MTLRKGSIEEFEAWFKKLQALTEDKLDPEDWVVRWYSGYTPEQAWKNYTDE